MHARAFLVAALAASAGAIRTDLTGVHLKITSVHDGDGQYINMLTPDLTTVTSSTEWTGFFVDMIDRFGPFRRNQILILYPKSGDNILTEENLKGVLDVHEDIAFNIVSDEKKVSFEDSAPPAPSARPRRARTSTARRGHRVPSCAPASATPSPTAPGSVRTATRSAPRPAAAANFHMRSWPISASLRGWSERTRARSPCVVRNAKALPHQISCKLVSTHVCAHGLNKQARLSMRRRRCCATRAVASRAIGGRLAY